MTLVPCCLEPVRPERSRVRLTVEYRGVIFFDDEDMPRKQLEGHGKPGDDRRIIAGTPVGSSKLPVPLKPGEAHWLQAVDAPAPARHK